MGKIRILINIDWTFQNMIVSYHYILPKNPNKLETETGKRRALNWLKYSESSLKKMKELRFPVSVACKVM